MGIDTIRILHVNLVSCEFARSLKMEITKDGC